MNKEEKDLIDLLKFAGSQIEETTLKLNGIACKTIYEYINQLETSKQKLINFLENESSELHDYDNNHDLTYEGKGRMYLVDELLEKINLANSVK